MDEKDKQEEQDSPDSPGSSEEVEASADESSTAAPETEATAVDAPGPVEATAETAVDEPGTADAETAVDAPATEDGADAETAEATSGEPSPPQARRRGTPVERERVSGNLAAIFGRKLGMLQVFDEGGVVQNVTAIAAGPCVITQVRTPQRDGYHAVQLGWGEKTKMNKPARGHLKAAGGDFRNLREVRVDDSGNFAVGQEVGADIFQAGERVDVTASSKGRGFAGGVKRHNFHGGPKTHGQSDRHRAGGSIGAGTTPGHVLKGQRMPGHMGAVRVTVRALTVVSSDAERNILLIRGSVPGPVNGLVQVKRTTRGDK